MKLKRGDRVEQESWGKGTLLCLHIAADGKEWGFVEYDDRRQCFGFEAKYLTRIEPEPVTLTPKYEVGERVRILRNDIEGEVAGAIVTYDLAYVGGRYAEDELEPVPATTGAKSFMCSICGGRCVAE